MAESFQSGFDSRAERIAHNEAWCRDLNQRKAEWMESGDLAAGFRCECWDLGCADRIHLAGREWQQIRARPDRFAVAPGHVAAEPGIETVIEKQPHFWIVEKHGEAADEAERLA